MRLGRLGWLVALTMAPGCDRVLGVGGLDAGGRDAGRTDAGDAALDGPVAPPDSPCGVTVQHTLPVIADTVLSLAAPNASFGQDPTLTIHVGDAGIFKSDLTSVSGQPTSFTLVLPRVDQASLSDGNGGVVVCGAPTHRPGAFEVAFLRSDWDEATATYGQRSTAEPWQLAGATGAADRSPALLVQTYDGGTELRLTFPADALSSWLLMGHLSFIVTARDDAAQLVTSTAQLSNDMCAVNQLQPTLVVAACP